MKIAESEWRVMRVVWEQSPVSAADVIEVLLPETGWSHRTVRTLLGRLVEKGALAAEVDGHRYLYRPLVSRAKCMRTESRSFLEKVFDGDTAELLVHFVKHGRIKSDDVEHLKRLLDERRKGEK